MTIIEAVKKAMEIDGYIKPGKFNVFIKPTNSNDRCIVYIDKNRSRRGWEPCANDFLSEDWEAVSEEDFLFLSAKYNPC